MLLALRLNHIVIRYTQQALIKLGLSIADGSKGYQDILDWIKSHLV